MYNLSIALEDNAQRIPNRLAIISEEKKISYKELNLLSNKVANLILDLGINPGDSIALQCPNISFFPIIYYGILKMGGVIVPMSILLKKKEISFILNNSKAKLLFFYQGDQTLNIVKEAVAGVKESPEIIQSILIENQELKSFSNPLVKNLNSLIKDASSEFEYIPTNAEETAVVIYTSGTTGKPKGAKLTHSNLAWNSSITVDLFDFKGDDIALTVLPLFHIFGQNCIMNAAVFAGISNVLLKRFDSNEVIQCIQKHSVTIFAGVPTMFWNLLNDLNTLLLLYIIMHSTIRIKRNSNS